MVEKPTITTIYVFLLDEGVDVWRPVDAILIRDSIYQINPDTVIPETETWQFLPGELVRGKERRLMKGDCIVAVEKAEFQEERKIKGKVEAEMLAYIKSRLDAGALSVPENEIMNAVIPPDHPEFRYRPAYKYGLERLHRRLVINAVDDAAGARHYFLGNFASEALRKSLGGKCENHQKYTSARMEFMLKKLLQNSLTVLRRPTVKTFQEVNVDNWQWAFLYLAIGTILATLITMLTNILQAPVREQQRLELLQQFGSSWFTSLLNNMQNPLFTVATGILSFFFVVLLWMLLPYGLGRAFGGSKSFGNFAYNNSLFITPITILDSLLALVLGSISGGLFLFLSLFLDAIRFYLVYVNLQATLGLSKGKSALVIFIPILLAVILFCGLIVFFAVAMVSQ